MTTGYGYKGWLGLAEESTFGTGIATPTDFFEIVSENLVFEQSQVSKPHLRSASRHIKMKSKKTVSGTITLSVGWTGYALLFKHILGSAGTQTGTGPWTHPMVLTDDLPVGLTLWINRDHVAVTGNSLFRFVGCQINKATLKVEADDLMMLELDIVGTDSDLVATQTPTFVVHDPISWDELTLASTQLNSVVTTLNTFELTVDNKLDVDRFVLGQQTRIGFGRTGPREVTLKSDIEWGLNATVMHPHSLYRSQAAFFWTTVFSDGTHTMTFTAPNAFASAGDPVNDDPGKLIIPMEADAYRNTADNDELTLDLVDNTDLT